jgi:GLPGLI family protein
MKRAIQILLLILVSHNIKAQAVFVRNAKITFEKKVNIHRLMEEDIDEEEKSEINKYYSTFWEHSFNETTSSYKFIKAQEKPDNGTSFSMNDNGEMYTELDKNKRVLKKSIFDKDYILTDTIPTIDWKITHEVREIAGYDCRKAIGIVNDSVYVVAFYTNEILFKGGPEGFTGLPGMILGIAVPRHSTTWFATKVEEVNIPIQTIIAPVKGKIVDSDVELNKLIKLLKNEDYSKKPPKTEQVKSILYGFFL